MAEYNDEDCMYALSEAEAILEEYKLKMRDVLLDSVKEDISCIKKENARLKDENAKLKGEISDVRALERKIKIEKENLRRTVRNERLSELMQDFNIILYKVDADYIKLKKCDKCDEDRLIHFTLPSGKDMYESCECDKSKVTYIPEEYYCVEFHLDKGNDKLYAWYEQDEDDEDTYTRPKLAKEIYNKEMNFEDLDVDEIFFRDKEDCQRYCDWLNEYYRVEYREVMPKRRKKPVK